MVVSVKIGLLLKDTRFLPSGSDISDTCLRHSHLHESYAYYIAPTCWLPRELSSSVAGNNSKLLLLVICHPASAIIYVHRTIVFWPTGHFVCLRFQLYDARSGEPPPMPSEPKPGARREAPLQMNVSLPFPNWIRETRRETHGLPLDRVREGYMLTKTERRVIGMVYISEELIRKGTSLITAVWRGGSRFASALSRLRPPPAAGQGGREKSLTWPPVKWACRELLEIGGGTNAEEGETHASQSAMKCNLAPIGLGLQGASIDPSLLNNGEGERRAEGEGCGGYGEGCGVRGHSTSRGVLLM